MTPADFDWRLIQTFLAALDCGSLLAASRRLQTSQPTVGRQLAELEAQLGTVLFERTGRGLRPTEAAHLIAPAARDMARQAHGLMRSLERRQSTLAGSVRISASQLVACVLLPPVLARLRETHPEIEVDLVVSNDVSNLLEREADLAVRMVTPQQGSLIARRLPDARVVACASRRYLERHPPLASVADLSAHELVGFDREPGILDGFGRMGMPVTRDRFAFRTDDLMAYWAGVQAGLGVGFVTEYLVQSDPSVVPVLPGLALPGLPMWLVVHREIRSTPRIRAVYDFLAEAIAAALPR